MAMCFSLKAHAVDSFEYVPYVGVDYSYTNAKAFGSKPNYNLLSVNIGTKYNNFFGTEAFFEQSASDTRKINTKDKIKTSYRSYGLDLSAYLPIGCYHTFDLVGTVGIGEYVFYDKLNKQKHNSNSSLGYRIGAGFVYNIQENVSLRTIARYVNLQNITNVNHLYEYTIGLRYHFY